MCVCEIPAIHKKKKKRKKKDLAYGLKSNVKIFADDTSLFSVTVDNLISSNLNIDLRLIEDWAFQWKMLFNPDPSKQPIEILFSKKILIPQIPILTFNNNKICSKNSRKHL